MFTDPFTQKIGIDTVHQRQFRHRNAGLQTSFNQFALGLSVVTASPIPLVAYNQSLHQFWSLLCHRCPPCFTWTHLSSLTLSGKVRALLSAYIVAPRLLDFHRVLTIFLSIVDGQNPYRVCT